MAVFVVVTLLVFSTMAGFSATANSYQAGQKFIPGGGVTQPPPRCDSEVDNKAYVISEGCSPYFFKYCAAQRDIGSQGYEAYSPNCVGYTDQSSTTALLKDISETIDPHSNSTEPKVVRCLKLLKPFLCGAYYPLAFKINGFTLRVTPCFNYCIDVLSICKDAGLVPKLPLSVCDTMFKTHCPRNGNVPCMKSPALEAHDCFEVCNSTQPGYSGIATCTSRTRKCEGDNGPNRVRTSIALKKFKTTNFKFAAQVKVLEEVHLCQPVNSIAYKVQVLNDYYLECKTCDEYSYRLTSGSVTYVLSTDSVTDCSKRCVRPKIEVDKEYFMMGSFYESETVKESCQSNVWVLDSIKTANSLLYPWKTVEKKGKVSKVNGWIRNYYRCTGKCSRGDKNRT